MVAEIKGVSHVELVGAWILFLMWPAAKYYYYWDADTEVVNICLGDFSWWLK